jgi:UTP--glucose-1-phosphate uridylyltransferase
LGATCSPRASSKCSPTRRKRQLLKHEKIYGFRFEGRRYDAGDKLGFLQATVELALRREDLGEPFRAWLESLEQLRVKA